MPPLLQVLLQVLVLGILGWKAPNTLRTKPWQALSRPAAIQILFFLWIMLSLLWSSNSNEGWVEVQSKLPLLTWPLVFAWATPLAQNLRQALLRWTWISSASIAILCVMDVIVRSTSPAFWFGDMVYENLARFSGLHPIYLSVWVLLGMLAYVQDRVGSADTTQNRLFHALFLGGSLVFVTQLSSRMALLTAILLLGASLLFLYLNGRLRLIYLPAFLGAVLLPLLLIQANSVNQSRFGEMVNPKGTYQSDRWGGRALRIQKWKHTLDTYQRSPLLGTGAGDFQEELLQTYHQKQFQPGLDHRFNSHNQYLQTLATLGPLGLALLLLWFLEPLRWHWQDRYWLGTMAVLLVAASMMTESMLERQKGIYIVGLLANGYFCFRNRTTTSPHESVAPQTL